MTALLRTEVTCCVCDSTTSDPFAAGWDFEYRTSDEEFTFVRCRDCEHVYLNPRPANEELQRIYPDSYYAYDLSSSVNPIALAAKNFLERRKITALLRHCRSESPRCLDVGCGDGRILDRLASCGVPAEHLHGVELKADVLERLRAKGYHGYHGRAEDLDLPDGSFDFITLFQVIEHVADPAAMFASLGRLLAPGGVLIIETPNIRALDARLFRRRYWGGYHFPRHWNLFSSQTLQRLAARSGLDTVRLETFVCAVFMIYPFHHALREWGWPRPVYRFFWPMSNPLLLGLATLVDLVLAPLGLSANLRGVFIKPTAAG